MSRRRASLRGLAGRRGAVNAVLGWTGRPIGARLAAYHEVRQQRCEIHRLPRALRLQATLEPQGPIHSQMVAMAEH